MSLSFKRARAKRAACALSLSIGFSTMGLFNPTMAWAQPAGFSASQLAGSGKLTVFGFEAYSARLWVAPGFTQSTYAQHALALELTYLRSFKGQAIAERSLKEMRRIERFTDAQAQAWLTELQRVFPDVQPGDRLTGILQPGAGLRFLLNDKPLADIPDPLLARLFMGIWLSPRTSEPSLRETLLTGTAP